MIPLYATKPTEETTRQHDRSGITIFGRQFEETFYFDHLQGLYSFSGYYDLYSADIILNRSL